MQNIQSIALQIKSDIVVQARQVGCTPQEITAIEEIDFFEDAEAEIRVELAALGLNHRRAFRAAPQRHPATRRAPRRHSKKKVSSSGASDGDGARWSNEAIDHFFSRLMPICLVDIATGQKGTSVVKLFSSVNRISTPEAACFLAHYASKYIAARGVLEFEEAIELFRASNFSLNNRMT